MYPVVEEDESFNLMYVGLFGAQTKMLQTSDSSDLVQEFWSRHEG